MVHGKNKGDNFERRIANVFSEAFGIDIRRTPLSGGWAKGNPGVSGDLVCVDPGPEALCYCIECKNAEGWRLESLFIDKHKWFDDWWQQTLDECPEEKDPMLVFSRAYAPVFVTIQAFVIYDIMNYPRPRVELEWIDGTKLVIITLDDYIEWTCDDKWMQ